MEAEGGVRALELIASETFDAVLLDIMMPDLSGFEVLSRIRSTHSPESLPVIMVTARTETSDIVKALESGANDYVTKPVDFAIALARVSAQVERKRAIEAVALTNAALKQSNDQLRVEVANRKRSEAETRYLAHHDALTGLANRLLFYEELERALAKAHSECAPLAILFIDLDGFKRINDGHGHSVGDALLKQIGQRMLARLDQSVCVARIGGDEFAVLQTSSQTSGAQPEAVIALCEQLLAIISEPCCIGALTLVVNASIGIALADNEKQNVASLIRGADIAMYNAKSHGTGNYRQFDRAMETAAQATLRLEADMRAALANNEFQLYYQPIVSTTTGCVTAYEALLRWKHAERGFISPVEFIPLAESTGLIIQLGEWVLRQACADASEWPSNIRVAVNLSAVQFQNAKLVEIVLSALVDAGMAACRLELEITETVLLDNSDHTLDVLTKLRGLGARIALDDFGTGFSSLSYLRSIPFDKIKIDRSFVANLPEDARSQTIVGAITGLGRSFGMSITAEGVETAAQLACIIAQGCTEVQGFFYSQAVPGGDVLNLTQAIALASHAAAAPKGSMSFAFAIAD